MMILFTLVMERQYKRGYQQLPIALLGMLLFAFPTFFLSMTYLNHRSFKETLQTLAIFMHKHDQYHSAYFFTTRASFVSLSNELERKIKLGYRLPSLWMVAGLVNKELLLRGKQADPQFIQDKNFVIKMIADDLSINKPDLVFIDVSKDKLYMEDKHFEYLPYFAQNSHFMEAWKAYHFLTTVEHFPFYKLDVYARTVGATAGAPTG